MGMIDEGVKLILPPKHDASERHVHGWRWVIVVAMLLLITNAAGGRGWLPFIPAYAMGSDVKVLLELQYAEVIRGLQTQICNASGQNVATLQQTLEDYQRRYRDLTGQRYPTTPCPPKPPSN